MTDDGYTVDADQCRSKFEDLVEHYQELKAAETDASSVQQMNWRFFTCMREIFTYLDMDGK